MSHEARDILLTRSVDPSLELGARNAVETCLAVQRGDQVLIVCEKGLEQIGAAMAQAADVVEAEVSAFILQPGDGSNTAFTGRLAGRLAEADVSVLVASVGGLPKEFRRQLLHVEDRRRHAHMVGITEAMMRQSMRADYEEVDAIGRRLCARLERAREMHIETSAGTSLVVRLHPKHRWHNASGLLRGPGWANLPGGEVFSAPLSVEGVVVPDGGMFMPDGTEISRGGRVRVRFEPNEITKIEGPGAEEAQASLAAIPNGLRVGQIGFGTNTSLLTSVGALLQDLKMPGVHLTLGDTCPELTGAEWSSTVEVPLLMRRADVSVDGEPIMVRGRYARTIGPQ